MHACIHTSIHTYIQKEERQSAITWRRSIEELISAQDQFTRISGMYVFRYAHIHIQAYRSFEELISAQDQFTRISGMYVCRCAHMHIQAYRAFEELISAKTSLQEFQVCTYVDNPHIHV
jgi:hypothetical protein